MEFEDIQKSWHQQAVQPSPDTEMLNLQQNNWQKNQQKLKRANVGMSLGFLAAMVGIGWVYISFKDEYGMAFKLSIAVVYFLMIAFLFVSWRSYSFKQINTVSNNQDYIEQQIKKLMWQKDVIIKYTWIYTVLLWMAMMLYIWEITMEATPTFRYTAMAITSLYIFGITFWNRVKKKQRQLDEINVLINDLGEMRSGLNSSLK